MNGFAELLATLVSELSCHCCVNFKRVGFDIYIYVSSIEQYVSRLQVFTAKSDVSLSCSCNVTVH